MNYNIFVRDKHLLDRRVLDFIKNNPNKDMGEICYNFGQIDKSWIINSVKRLKAQNKICCAKVVVERYFGENRFQIKSQKIKVRRYYAATRSRRPTIEPIFIGKRVVNI